MNKTRLFLCSAILSLVLFFTLLFLVLFIDIGAVGPLGSEVGLSSVNATAFSLIGTSTFWFYATEWVIWLAIAVALGFAALGVYQLIKRKSLRLVDRYLFVLAGLYMATAVAFLIFEIFPVNFRPVLDGGEFEASFPSSHVLISLPIILSAFHEFTRRVSCKTARIILASVVLLIAIFLPVGRLLSGVHWLTDIIGGLLLSTALTFGYLAARSYFD